MIANSLSANGGSITSTGGTDASLAHTGLSHNPAHKVNHMNTALGDMATTPVPSVPAIGLVLLAGLLVRRGLKNLRG